MAKQLRTKTNEDLHKLWYVLLKEKNMLLTTEQESKRQRIQMPSPERLKKIERSMKRHSGEGERRRSPPAPDRSGESKTWGLEKGCLWTGLLVPV
ncbi:large ribosomal subunit protein uL29m-like isoform X2 [Oncorhynchus nerka]